MEVASACSEGARSSRQDGKLAFVFLRISSLWVQWKCRAVIAIVCMGRGLWPHSYLMPFQISVWFVQPSSLFLPILVQKFPEWFLKAIWKQHPERQISDSHHMAATKSQTHCKPSLFSFFHFFSAQFLKFLPCLFLFVCFFAWGGRIYAQNLCTFPSSINHEVSSLNGEMSTVPTSPQKPRSEHCPPRMTSTNLPIFLRPPLPLEKAGNKTGSFVVLTTQLG